jgi:hypothetical protein
VGKEMIYSRENPTGMDKKIKVIQEKLEKVFISLGFSTGEFDLYDRIYRMERSNEIVPVVFINEQYNNTLFSNDKVFTGYFYERSEAVNNHGLYNITLGNVFHVNLSLMFPEIKSRADQEFTKILTDVYAMEPYGFRAVNFTTGLDRMTDLNYKSELEMVHPYFHLRVDLNLNFRI